MLTFLHSPDGLLDGIPCPPPDLTACLMDLRDRPTCAGLDRLPLSAK